MKKIVIIAAVIIAHILLLLMISGSEEKTTPTTDTTKPENVTPGTTQQPNRVTPATPQNGGSVVRTPTQKTYEHHVVKSGDNLSAIAKKYDTTVAQIKAWNNLKDDKIFVGKKLVVSVK